jgi:hypothetical protein
VGTAEYRRVVAGPVVAADQRPRRDEDAEVMLVLPVEEGDPFRLAAAEGEAAARRGTAANAGHRSDQIAGRISRITAS